MAGLDCDQDIAAEKWSVFSDPQQLHQSAKPLHHTTNYIYGGTPSLSQAIQMKKLSQSGELDIDKFFEILREPKANQQDKISFRVDDLRKFFPKSYSAARIQAYIVKLLEVDLRKRQRAQER